MNTFDLRVLSAEYAVCRLDRDKDIPYWAQGELVSLTRTNDELSIVCEAGHLPADASSERGWRCLKVGGPLDFSMVGVIASLADCLAEARISVFVVSTYDTDYLLVKQERLSDAIESLTAAGHRVAPAAAD